MPAGFQVVGDHGYVQIDGEYKNFSFAEKGAATLVANASNIPSAAITVTADKPILCVRSPSAAVAIISVSTSGNSHTYSLVGSALASFDWYLFDQVPQTVADHGVGIVVYGADASVVFNADYPVMRIVGVATVPNGDGTATPATGSVSASAGTYAACLSSPRTKMVPTPSAPARYFLDGIQTSSTGASTAFFIGALTNPLAAGWGNNAGGTILLVDVSGL